MAKKDELLADILDSLSLDIDFNINTKRFEIKSNESDYTDQILYPTLTQLINQKSEEFMDAIFIDLNCEISFEIERVSEDEKTSNEDYVLQDIVFKSVKSKSSRSSGFYFQLYSAFHSDTEYLMTENEAKRLVLNLVNKGFQQELTIDGYLLKKKIDSQEKLYDFIDFYERFTSIESNESLSHIKRYDKFSY